MGFQRDTQKFKATRQDPTPNFEHKFRQNRWISHVQKHNNLLLTFFEGPTAQYKAFSKTKVKVRSYFFMGTPGKLPSRKRDQKETSRGIPLKKYLRGAIRPGSLNLQIGGAKFLQKKIQKLQKNSTAYG